MKDSQNYIGKTKLAFLDADPAHTDFQYIEDLATAYWYSEVLFAGLELQLFKYIEQGCSEIDKLASRACCNELELRRLLKVMVRMDLIHEDNGFIFNSQIARKFLVPGNPEYMGDFFLYRKYMKSGWDTLVSRVSKKEFKNSGQISEDDDYEERNFHYVRSTDALVRQKADEIAGILSKETWQSPILDVGCGAGALSRAIISKRPDAIATLFDLPEVIRAAKRLYPDEKEWKNIDIAEGDFRSFEFEKRKKFGLIILSNFLHAYGADDSQVLLQKAISLLESDGLLLIHDYFPDRKGRSPQKGALYDLAMMLNTYDGSCQDSKTISTWLKDGGMVWVQIRELSTDSSIILASGKEGAQKENTDIGKWIDTAIDIGFKDARYLPVDKIVTASWVRAKCENGCAGFGKNLQCPPNGMTHHETKEMLQSYNHAIILENMPPGKHFHSLLLRLEKEAFLAGHPKAFVLGAGPCPVCDECSEDGKCRFPEKARPSMEGSGIDVYATSANAGINLKPVKEKGQYVKYIGLLLLE